MLSFATEFSVDASRTTADFLQAMVTWISGSPHTSLSADMLRELQQKEEASVLSGNERVESLVSRTADLDLAGIRYGGPSSFRVEHNSHNDSWSSSPVGMCAGRWPACAHVHEACLIRRMSPWALP